MLFFNMKIQDRRVVSSYQRNCLQLCIYHNSVTHTHKYINGEISRSTCLREDIHRVTFAFCSVKNHSSEVPSNKRSQSLPPNKSQKMLTTVELERHTYVTGHYGFVVFFFIPKT